MLIIFLYFYPKSIHLPKVIAKCNLFIGPQKFTYCVLTTWHKTFRDKCTKFLKCQIVSNGGTEEKSLAVFQKVKLS